MVDYEHKMKVIGDVEVVIYLPCLFLLLFMLE